MAPDTIITTTSYTQSWDNGWTTAQAQDAALHAAHALWGLFGILLFGFVLFYFLPTLVATIRRHPHATLIFLLNLFFGVTVAGWILALLWAMTSPGRPRIPQV